MTTAQQRAFVEHWTRYGLDPQSGAPAWPGVFGRVAPLILEIGFGNGEQLLWSSLHEPDRDFLGIEVHRPGVGRVMNALAANNVDNVRLYNNDAVGVLEQCIAAASLSGVIRFGLPRIEKTFGPFRRSCIGAITASNHRTGACGCSQ